MSEPTWLVLPYPPQVNNYYTVARGRKVLGKQGRQYHKVVAGLTLMLRLKPLTGRLSVTIQLAPPDKQRRDLDNVLKPLLDAMQYAGLYVDDSQIDYLSIRRLVPVKGGEVGVKIEEIP